MSRGSDRDPKDGVNGADEPVASPGGNGGTAGEGGGSGIDRRTFLRRSGLGAGTLAVTGGMGALLSPAPVAAGEAPAVLRRGRQQNVVVIGAGAFGAWTAYHLQKMGVTVSLVDLYGPGNSRSTSGDETRGIRTAYGDRTLWTDWASKSLARWKEFDAEFSPRMGHPVYYPTGDIILRAEFDTFLQQTQATWEALGIEHERLDVDEVRRRWPQFGLDGITVGLYEPDAGVARARAAVRRVAQIVQDRGAPLHLGRANLGNQSGGRVSDIVLGDQGERVGGDIFVFALGPWFAKQFPDFMAPRMRIPMGVVFYYGTPPGDHRFSHPNIPSWNFPGVTGWANLPLDQRGFRVRSSGKPGDDPDTSVRWVAEEFHERSRGILAERFPDMADAPILETRSCHYESTVTRDWIIDRHPGLENVWIAGGGNAEGFKFGPMIGELIAGRVIGADVHPDLTEQFRIRDEDLGPPPGEG